MVTILESVSRHAQDLHRLEGYQLPVPSSHPIASTWNSVRRCRRQSVTVTDDTSEEAEGKDIREASLKRVAISAHNCLGFMTSRGGQRLGNSVGDNGG